MTPTFQDSNPPTIYNPILLCAEYLPTMVVKIQFLSSSKVSAISNTVDMTLLVSSHSHLLGRYFSRKPSARSHHSRPKSRKMIQKTVHTSQVSHILDGRHMVVSQSPIVIHTTRVICDFSWCTMASSRTITNSRRCSRKNDTSSTVRQILRSSRSSSRICMSEISSRRSSESSRVSSVPMLSQSSIVRIQTHSSVPSSGVR